MEEGGNVRILTIDHHAIADVDVTRVVSFTSSMERSVDWNTVFRDT